MYILFYPLQFPSIPVLILFKVLQHHNNLLSPRTGLEPAFILWHREYLQTCAYSWIQPLAVRDTVTPHCQITYITHLPDSTGWLYHLPTRWYLVGKTGLEPATPSSQNWCSSQLNYFPFLPVPNLSVLVHLQVDFPGSTPVIPLSATLHVLYLELLTSSYTYSYYLLRFTPQSFSNPLSSFREHWVTHDLSLIVPVPCKASHKTWMPCSLKSYILRLHQGASYV